MNKKPTLSFISLPLLFVAVVLVDSFLWGACSNHQEPHVSLEAVAYPTEGERTPDPNIERLGVMGTGDIHGVLEAMTQKTTETNQNPSVVYTQGGAPMLGAYLKTLRRELQGRLLWVDAGDQFQGSIESNTYQGQSVVTVFNHLGLTAAAVGNHEFDFGQTPLQQRIQEAHYPYLVANVLSTTANRPSSFFPGTLPSTLVQAGRLRVGIIGLITPDTPRTSMARNLVGLTFTPLQEAALRESQWLRQHGAHVVILVTHAGVRCQTPPEATGLRLRKATDPQGSCDPHDEIPQLLQQLPVGTLDAVIAGHTHEVVHQFLPQGPRETAAKVPVIEAGYQGRYANLIYFSYDFRQKRLLSEETRIEGPIPICEKVFAHQKNCDGIQTPPENGRGLLARPVFHGQAMYPDAETEQVLAPIKAQVEAAHTQIIAQAARRLHHTRTEESALGNLVSDAMREATHADIALINGGGIRASIEAGPISQASLLRSIPFDNNVSLVTLKGEQLTRVLRKAQTGAYKWFSISGATMKLRSLSEPAARADVDQNGIIEPNEWDRVLEIRLANGLPIQPNKMYTLATLDFLITGGDGMGPVFASMAPSQIQLNAAGSLRELVQNYLRHKGILNTTEQPCLDPNHPRLRIETPSRSLAGSL